MEAWRLNAATALELIRNDKLTVEEYADSLLARIKDRDAQVKAWVYLNPELILSRAKYLDRIPRDERGPLHGLPIGIKDVALTEDMPTQYNSRLFSSSEPSGIDAAPVMTLRQSGALIFGKTTTTEFASSQQGDWHQNLTKNAHDPERTPGGSSSGSGAAVGDHQVPIALGTQTGGSIVRPASFNGCYGWKPTWGAISREGLAQWCVTLDTCGFLARSIEDLVLMADVFRIQDDKTLPNNAFTVKAAKIAFCKTHNWPRAGPGTRHAMARAQHLLAAHGAQVEDLELPDDFAPILDWHADILAGEGRASFLGPYLSDKARMHESIRDHVENGRGVTRAKLLEAYDKCARLRPIWDEIASGYDAVLAPSVVDEAPVGRDKTGDMVSSHLLVHRYSRALLTTVVCLLNVDRSTRASLEHPRLPRREWDAYWLDTCRASIH